jgi:hypothetical protein
MLYFFLVIIPIILIILHRIMNHHNPHQEESGTLTVSNCGEISIPLGIHPQLVEVSWIDEEKHQHPCHPHHHHKDHLFWEIKHFGQPALFIAWEVNDTRQIKWQIRT